MAWDIHPLFKGENMKSLMLFLRSVITDCGDRCSASTQLDLKTIELRLEHEGLSFLTITLPNFGKEFERALDLGYVENTMFTSFSKHRGLPRFLGGFLSQVFEFGTGRLLTEPSKDAILSIRQITLLYGKMHALCSKDRERAALAGYVNLDQKVGHYEAELRRSISSDSPVRLAEGSRGDVYERGDVSDFESSRKAALNAFIAASKWLFREATLDGDREFYLRGVVPKHGPGSTADGLKGNLKYRQRIWTARLESLFPFGEYAFPSWRSYLEDLPGLTFLDPGDEMPSKVISVPKTMKTPRLIAVEPTCMQYVQQGMMALIYETLQKDSSLWRMIGFDDQTPNQRFARKGSITGDYATLDLSEASDRVNMWHVETLFASSPTLLAGIMACRSSKASVEGHGVISLSKFASMGSALCFPVEAMVFLTVVFASISLELNRPLRKKDIKSFSSQVRVFGDDIIVPKRFALRVVETMDLLGFKVNSSKSFWTGKFRESCGKEYYDGFDVSIVKVRQALPTRRKDTQEIISAVSMRNQFFTAGYTRTVEYLDDLIERFIPFPEVEETSPILGKLTWGPVKVLRMHPTLHIPLTRGVVVRPVKVRREIDGWPALMKWFLKDNELPFIDRNHLVYSGRPAALTLKACMASIR
jgi:hypothetical protein